MLNLLALLFLHVRLVFYQLLSWDSSVIHHLVVMCIRIAVVNQLNLFSGWTLSIRVFEYWTDG
jgi:hypothetical protein